MLPIPHSLQAMNMSSLWTDLLLLHGHITDWRLVRQQSLTPVPPEPASPAPPAIEVQNQHPTPARRSRLMLRLCLGIGSGELHRQ
jgi:hypothetical protein